MSNLIFRQTKKIFPLQIPKSLYNSLIRLVISILRTSMMKRAQKKMREKAMRMTMDSTKIQMMMIATQTLETTCGLQGSNVADSLKPNRILSTLPSNSPMLEEGLGFLLWMLDHNTEV